MSMLEFRARSCSYADNLRYLACLKARIEESHRVANKPSAAFSIFSLLAFLILNYYN